MKVRLRRWFAYVRTVVHQDAPVEVNWYAKFMAQAAGQPPIYQTTDVRGVYWTN